MTTRTVDAGGRGPTTCRSRATMGGRKRGGAPLVGGLDQAVELEFCVDSKLNRIDVLQHLVLRMERRGHGREGSPRVVSPWGRQSYAEEELVVSAQSWW